MRFILILTRIPHYEQRLKALVFKKSFNDRMTELRPQIQGLYLLYLQMEARSVVYSRVITVEETQGLL